MFYSSNCRFWSLAFKGTANEPLLGNLPYSNSPSTSHGFCIVLGQGSFDSFCFARMHYVAMVPVLNGLAYLSLLQRLCITFISKDRVWVTIPVCLSLSTLEFLVGFPLNVSFADWA